MSRIPPHVPITIGGNCAGKGSVGGGTSPDRVVSATLTPRTGGSLSSRPAVTAAPRAQLALGVTGPDYTGSARAAVNSCRLSDDRRSVLPRDNGGGGASSSKGYRPRAVSYR